MVDLVYQKMIYRKDIQENRDKLYLFGDNLQRIGWGGQAQEMRGEWNSIGVATKRGITHGSKDDYFFDNEEDVPAIIRGEFEFVRNFYYRSLVIDPESPWEPSFRFNQIVVPEDGLGTGLSRLPEYAPKTLQLIEDQLESLKELPSDFSEYKEQIEERKRWNPDG